MSKYHITEAGNPALCKAEIKACPRGGEDRHFSSKEEARTAYESENDKNTFANYATISFDERKQNTQEAFANAFPGVEIIKNSTAEKLEQKYRAYIAFRKDEEVIFKTKANTSKEVFSKADAEKFAKDNKLKYHYIQSAGAPEFDKHNHAVFTAIRPKSKEDKIRERQEKIQQLQNELNKI